MIKEIKKITNKNVDYKNLQENQLSIQLRLDGFSFCIYNKIQEELGAFASFEFEQKSITPFQHLELVEQLFKHEELLQLKYQFVTVSHFNNLVTQVPKPFFDKNKLSEYLKYTIKVLENDFVAFDAIKNSEIVNVYIPFVNINNFLIDQYGSFVYKHSATILIENLLSAYKNSAEAICFVNVTNANFEIIALKNNQLLLYNCFQFNTKEDFIYYILFTAEQLNLNPEEFKLVLLGDIEKQSELYTIAFQYIRNIEFLNPIKFPSILKEDFSEHTNFTLLNQL
jgi:hypothetical protein